MKVPVLIPRIFDQPHTYLSGNFKNLTPGTIVHVPFGKNEEVGVIWDQLEKKKLNIKLKTVLKKMKPFLIKSLIEFINWFSLYNLVPKGMVLKMFLGDLSYLEKASEKFLEHKIQKKIKYTLNNEQKKMS